ncbi:MAG: ion transporter [Bacteroidota bacterium]|nr:ion transporter [Bacteroidota bacterium]
MNLFRDTLLKNIALVIFGWVIFYIDDKEFLEIYYTKWLIIGLATFKTVFFFVQSIKKIFETSDKEVSYHHFLIFMGINIVLIIISFTIDFICLHQVDAHAFMGISANSSFFDICFEMLYFSVLGFNNLGFYDVIPMGKAAKILVMEEIFAYICTIIFILSDFMSLKESLLTI